MKIRIFTLILSFFMILSMNAQLKYFYYYKGEKYFLQLDKSSIAITANTDKNLKNLNTKTPIVENYTRNSLLMEGKKIANDNKIFYVEVESDAIISDSQYLSKIKENNNIPEVITASPTFLTSEGQKMGMSNNFYVKLKSKNDIKFLKDLASKNNAEVLGYNEYMPLWFTVAISKKSTFPTAIEMANLFYESGKFESTEPEFIYHNLQTSADPLFPDQWSLKNTGQYGAAYTGIDINAETAWTISTGSGVKTAIFDHGFEMDHPDLKNNVLGTGFDAQTNSSPSIVRGSHGTPCAGIAGAEQNNNIGISGVAPKTSLVSISINLLFSDTPMQLANGFNWATAKGIDIISNSWGGYAPSPIIENAITNALINGRGGKGMVVVFAAGNENNTNIRYPGIWNPDILVVGAMSPCGERKNPYSCDGESWWGSCYGKQLDVVAPGVLMPTTDRQGTNGYSMTDYTPNFNGTSSACPVVAGVAALVLSANPCLTGKQVRDIIEQTARKVRTDLYTYITDPSWPNGKWNIEMGYGLVDALSAVKKAKKTYDLAAFDSSADIGLEPNPSATTWANIYQSPDIWNRRTNNASLNLVHEEPGIGLLGHNVMRFRVHNIGCTTSAPSFARLYWTMASTGETWPNSWNGIQLINGYSAGGELTTPYTGFNSSNSYATGQGFKIPALAPGQSYIIDAKWNPVNPTIYGGLTDNGICFLGRIVTPNDPMYNENPGPFAPIEPNVTQNNNIVTRNTKLVKLNGGFTSFSTGYFVGNYFDIDKRFNLKINLVKSTAVPYNSIAQAIIKVTNEVWKRWEDGGKKSTGLEVYDYNNHEFIIKDPKNAAIQNVMLKPHEYFPVVLNFKLENTNIASMESYDFAVSQSITDEPDEIYGSVCHFIVEVNHKYDESGKDFCEEEECKKSQAKMMVLQDVKLSPNPASTNTTLEFNLQNDERVSIVLADFNGKILKNIANSEFTRKGINKKEIAIQELPSGVYIVSIITSTEKKSVNLIVK